MFARAWRRIPTRSPLPAALGHQRALERSENLKSLRMFLGFQQHVSAGEANSSVLRGLAAHWAALLAVSPRVTCAEILVPPSPLLLLANCSCGPVHCTGWESGDRSLFRACAGVVPVGNNLGKPGWILWRRPCRWASLPLHQWAYSSSWLRAGRWPASRQALQQLAPAWT